MVPQTPFAKWTETAPTGSSILAILSKNSTLSNERAEGGDCIAARRDGDQTGQRAVQGHGDIGLAVTQPSEDHGHAGGHGGGKVGVEADEACQGHGGVGGQAQGRAAVESEPADPEDEDAQRTGRQVVAGDGVGLPSLSYLPMRGPSMAAPSRAMTPPTL